MTTTAARRWLMAGWVTLGWTAVLTSGGRATATAPWDPCEADVATATAPGASAATFGEFGPLAAEPSLTIELPAAPSADDPDGVPMVTPLRVVGGIALLARTAAPGFAVTVVNDTGTVRWSSCFDGVPWPMAAAPGGDALLVASMSPAATDAPDRIELVSALDGSSLGDVTAAVRALAGGTTPVGVTPDGAFFSPGWGTVLGPDSQLARVDLRTLEVTGRPVPGAAIGTDAGALTLSVSRTGYLVASGLGGSAGADAVLYQGEWTTDPGVIESAAGPLVNLLYGATATHPGRQRPDGSIVWQRDDLTPWGGEGFVLAVTADAVLVEVCPSGDAMNCPEVSLVGLDPATGATRWELPGAFAAEWGDGFVLVGDDQGYRMVDAATAEPVDATSWPQRTFAEGCCGEGEVLHTDRLGGIVVTVDGRLVEVYYPAAAAPPAATVTLF